MPEVFVMLSGSGIILQIARTNEFSAPVASNHEEFCKRIKDMTSVIEGSLNFINTAELQSGHSFDINVSLSKDQPGRQEADFELYYLNLSFVDEPKHGAGRSRKKRVVSIELRYTIDDSYVADVGMSLAKYSTEVPATDNS